MIIAVDFDGTCVEHDFPAVGKDIPHAERVLKRIVDHGHKLILWTMRSDGRGCVLTDAVNWFKERCIPLWGVNCNPEQQSWTLSPKQYANIYIDDAALGVPLLPCDGTHDRPRVNWRGVEELLEDLGVLECEQEASA